MPSAQDVKVEIIRDLAAVPEAGLDRASQPSLFDRIEWFRHTWAHVPPGARPMIARAGDGWLFLAERANGEAVALASWYTLAFRPIDAHAPALIAIARALKPQLATIALDHVPATDAEAVRRAFADAGWIARVTSQTANWTIDVTGKSFADFWSERPGQLRSTAKRKAAKANLDLQILDRFDEAAWADYASIYADSWKPEEGSLSFVRAMAEDEGAAGTLRMGIARKDGRAIASQLWTVENGIAIIHKLAHREDAVELSPGTILSRAMFEHVIDRDRVSLIDFGTGDDRYKADWMDTRVMRMRVDLYNPMKPRGALAAVRALVRRISSR